MSPVRVDSGRRQPRLAPRSLSYWIRRYWLQDLCAALALLAAGVLLGHLPAGSLGPAAAAAELATFYGVAFLRHRREAASPRSTLEGMLAEYGPAEALDLVLRPALLTLAATLFPQTALVALLGGSLAADTVFYWTAALTHARTA